MLLPQTRAVMKFLRERASRVSPNNKKISSWVDDYVNGRALEGKPIVLLTQLCVAKDLEVRREKQGGGFIATRNERRLLAEEIPRIISAFRSESFSVNWYLTFNRSYLDFGRVDLETERLYKEMITELALSLTKSGQFIILDWEEDVLGARPRPSKEVLDDINEFVRPKALAREIEKHSKWALGEANLGQTEDELRSDVYFKIACEAEEGSLLGDADSPFGECMVLPLEYAERFDFFSLLSPCFKDRITAVLKPYPWRLTQ